MKTCVYQRHRLPKEGTQPWKVVSLVQINLRPPARAPIVLCSRDVARAYTLPGIWPQRYWSGNMA